MYRMPYLIMVVLVYRILNVSSTSVWAGFDEGMRARSQGSNPWQTQIVALGGPLLSHFPLDPIA
jgi:hypothetical protein